MGEMGLIPETDRDEILAGTEDVWHALRGARIFLTGGTGFFGVWLLSAFAHARQRLGITIPMTVLTRSSAATTARHGALLAASGVTLHEGDARTFAFPEGSFSHVIHGATTSGSALDPGDPFEMLDVVAGGTRRAVTLAAQSGCSRFLLMSSGAVYGPQPSSVTHVPETLLGGPDPLSPASSYAEGKRVAEHTASLAAVASGFAVTVARGFAFVGPHLPLDAHFAIGNFLRDGLAGRPIRILGDGTPYRSYLYGTDLATWLWTMLVKGRAGTAYNVGSDDGRPLRDIAARVGAATGVEVRVAKTAPEGHVPARYVPDTTRARTELGLTQRVGLDEAIRRTLAFHTAGSS